MDQAAHTGVGLRLVEILTSILEEHDDVYGTLACTLGLLKHGTGQVFSEVAAIMREMERKDPSELARYIDLIPVNPFMALIKEKPAEVCKRVERQISISALITAHAFFESVLKDLLRVTMICARERWLAELPGKSVTFGDVSTKGIDQCANDLLEKELNKLGQAGMPALVGKLLGFCKGNVTTKSHFQNYHLDLERLKSLDKLRHDYAHRRTKLPYTIKQADSDLRYLTITGVHLVTCIIEAYDMKGQQRFQPSP